ncbi:hypothetical protein 1 [Beihai picorna-like virus 5]|uniref:hypothetical protein 1 n=1 Tax=Beihai picorna-like virus 5 TaxID=1922594 RepID=UPI00090ADAAE|nr:hypothetical protein 1 [Beihai picorna-like virus 5]APG76845.1 hypothetical protein 1 [Beihai picorna-like virus 5]
MQISWSFIGDRTMQLMRGKHSNFNTTDDHVLRQVHMIQPPLAANFNYFLKLSEENSLILADEPVSPNHPHGLSDETALITRVPVMIGDQILVTEMLRTNRSLWGMRLEEKSTIAATISETSSTSNRPRSVSVRSLRFRDDDDHFDEAMEMYGFQVDYDSDFSVTEYVQKDCPYLPLPPVPNPSEIDVHSDGFIETKFDDDYTMDTQGCSLPPEGAPDSEWDYFFGNCTHEEFQEAPLEKFEEWRIRIKNMESPASKDKLDGFDPHSGVDYTLNPGFTDIPEEEVHARIARRLKFAARIKAEMMSITEAEIDLQAKLFNAKLEKIHIERKLRKFQAHQGEEDSIEFWLNKLDKLSDRMTDYSKILSSREVDSVIKHVERLILLFLELRETRSYSGMMAAILGYLQGLTGKSLFNTVREYLADALAMEAHDGDEDEETPAWLEVFRSVTKNWNSVTKMPAWKYFQRILSLAVSAGLCKAADVNFRIGDMKMFTLKIEEKQASACDLMDAILATADYFVEAGYEAFKTRSIRPFFFDNQTARILDEAYIGISASMKALPTGDLEKTKYKSEAELAHVLENTLSGYIILRHQTKNPSEKRTLDARCMQLEEWKLLFIQQTVSGGLREAPYSIYLVGKPGIGKSMMTQVLVEVVLQANGVKYTQKQVATVNPGDKFASTVKNDTVVIILDDFGNFVLEFETENPLKYIIEICNNVVSYVPKAEANEKGKIAWRPKMVVTTSNIDDLLFNKLSNAPGSAKRRGIRMKPFLKPEYAEHDRFSEDKYRAANNGLLPAVPDAYDIDIQEWGVKKWEYMPFKDGDTKRLSYAEALEFHIQKSRDHFKKQKDYVKNHGKIREQIVICEHAKVRSECPKCRAIDEEEEFFSEEGFTQEKFDAACAAALGHEAHFGTETVVNWMWRWMIGRFLALFTPIRTSFSDYLRDSSNEQLQLLNAKLHFFSLFGFYDWLPDCVVETEMFENYLLFMNSSSIALKYWQLLLTFFMSFFLFLTGPAVGGTLNGLIVWPYLVQCATVTHVRVIEEFRERRGALPVEFTASRDKFLKYALAGTFMLTGLAAAYKLYSSSRVMEPHGNIAPTTMKDIKERDAEQSDWAKTVVEALPVTDKCKCITYDELHAKVKKNLVYVRYPEGDKFKFTNGFFYNSNELLIPYHILSKEPKEYQIFRRGEHIRGGQFKEILSVGAASVHPTKDVAMVQCCNTAPFEDLREYFALEDHPQAPFSMTVFHKDDTFSVGHGLAKKAQINNSVRKSEGYLYLLRDMDTFQGMCMATMISQTRAPQIIGFHIGGKTGTGEGCGVSLTRSELDSMHDQYFAKHISALEHISEGTVFTEHYGVEWFESPDIHPKSPLNWLPEECNIRYFGSCKGRATYYTEVVPTPIADLITEVCGHEQDYGGPHFHRWKSWYESLVYSCNPSIGCEIEHLDWAVQDYENQLWGIFSVEGIMEEVKKLSEIEIVSGKDGIRFIDAMPPNTSCGYPLGGPKRGKIIELEPNDEHNCPRTFCTGVWEEVRRFKAAIRSGQRYYPMFKACLKDEPTKAEKEKVRVFQAAPLSLQIAIREYFLPIARVLSLFPLVSECAVGINAQGPEWDVLQEYIKKFGIDRIVAGDYAKYDLRMSAKLTSAAFKILIDFAEKCGYSQDDLAIMRGIATEVVYPMMAYNGDVVMLQGSNPSGQNLTVYINSIVNSLLNRIGFRMIYPNYTGRFCDAVALATYGDDFKSSASDEFPDFHHVSLAEKLATIDMKITMPDKEADPIPFLLDENCDFLKRHNRLHEVGYYIGALDEESIFKSLKAVLRSKHVSLKEQAAQNIDGALREWFLHGREIYENRREQMKVVAARGDIAHMCTGLDETFDDRVRVWREKYTPLSLDDELVEVEETIFEEHSGYECQEYTEIAIDRMAEIQHTCRNGVEYLWYTPLPGPHLPVDYVKLMIVLLPILWYMFYYGAIALFTIYTLGEVRRFVHDYLRYLAQMRKMEKEMLGLNYEFLREHPHIAAAA